MANNRINFGSVMGNGKKINSFLPYLAEKATYNAAKTALSEAKDALPEDVYSFLTVKGDIVMSPIDLKKALEIEESEEVKAAKKAVNFRNTARADFMKAEKAMLDLVPDADDAFLLKAEDGDDSGLYELFCEFYRNLGVECTDEAAEKVSEACINRLAAGKFSEKASDLRVKFVALKGKKAKLEIWRAFHCYLTEGFNVRKKDDKGNFVYKIGKNGKPTKQNETVIKGGNYKVVNAEDGSLMYTSRHKEGTEVVLEDNEE